MALKINPITGKFDLLGSTPDWNQNNETATDYIKNRTHYEKLEDHREMFDDEYNEKKSNGSTFVLTKIATEVINSNEYSSAKGVEVGNRNDFDKIYDNIFKDTSDTYTGEGNKTKICYRIAINGIDVDLQWHKTDVYGGNEEISPDGTYEVFYGFAPSDNWMAAHHVVGNGIIVKHSIHAKGWYNGNGHYGLMAFLIDKTIYGEAPYTIDFYFECEQTIKKLDEKYLPESVWANVPKHKVGDVVILQQKSNPSSIGTKVISWEEFKATYQNYAYPGDRYEPGEFPIGLVVDPVKRTFLYIRQLEGSVYLEITSNIDTLGNTMYSNGIENSYQIRKHLVHGFGYLPNYGDSIFYNGSNEQLKQFVPSYKESVMCRNIIDNNVYDGEKFYERLIELSNLMQDSTNYPGISGSDPSVDTRLFYCFNSTIIKDGELFYIGNGLGNFADISLMKKGYMEFFGIYFDD